MSFLAFLTFHTFLVAIPMFGVSYPHSLSDSWPHPGCRGFKYEYEMMVLPHKFLNNPDLFFALIINCKSAQHSQLRGDGLIKCLGRRLNII